MNDEAENSLDIFDEPEGYFQKEPSPTCQSYVLKNGCELTLRLVGFSPLWGHHLWQAATTISRFLEEQSDKYLLRRSVLELGAGAGLPSLVAAVNGATVIVVTDYPENQLIENLRHNVKKCLDLVPCPGNVHAQSYLWGADPETLLHHSDTGVPSTMTRGFDTLLLADLLFNHSCHSALLKTITQTLAPVRHACALVFFTPYRPWLIEKDLGFFDLVRADGRLQVSDLGTWFMGKVMFEEDKGDELLRRTVFGFEVTWREDFLANLYHGEAIGDHD